MSNVDRVVILIVSVFITILSSHAAAKAGDAITIPAKDRFAVTDGAFTVECARLGDKVLSGTAVSPTLFKSFSSEIKRVKTALRGSKGKQKASLKKKLAKLVAVMQRGDTLCKQGPTPVPSATPTSVNTTPPVSPSTPTPTTPSSDAVSLEPLERAVTDADARYLAEKAGFGVGKADEAKLGNGADQGIAALVSKFMAVSDEDPALMPRVLDMRDGQIGSSTTQSPGGQRGALFELWANSKNAFTEKLALFLLSVWTVSGDVISDETFRGAYWDYYERLRTSAQGDVYLVDLGVELTRDPLMLLYLNNDLNVKGSPNENYARELMELFTLGTTDLDGNPNYSESGDIPSAAKMLTGFKLRPNYVTGKLEATYDLKRHEAGPHVMFAGTLSQFSGENEEDLIRGIFAHHPQVKTYYALEILKEYLTPNPPRELVERFAAVIEQNGYRLRPAMAVLLQSKAFFHESYRDTVPKNSIEFAVEVVKLLGLERAYSASTVSQHTLRMGMPVNMAPSVFWFNPSGWTSAAIVLERANFVAAVLGDTTPQKAKSPPWDPLDVLPSVTVTDKELLEFVARRVGITSLSENVEAALVEYTNKVLQYDGSYTNQVYDHSVAAHRRQKGMGAYYILFGTPVFQTK